MSRLGCVASLLVVACCVLLPACGSKTGQLNDSLTLTYGNGGKLDIKPTAAKADENYLHNEADRQWLAVIVDLRNPAKPDGQDVTYHPYSDVTLVDGDGQVYGVSDLQRSKSEDPDEVTLSPGGGLGHITFYFDRPPGLKSGDSMLDLVWTSDSGESVRWDLSSVTLRGWTD